MILAVTMMLTVTASAYVLPFAPTHHRCPARVPAIQAFAEDEPATTTSATRLHIRPLTTVFELERAVADSQARDRLCVVKVYAPWCKTCVAIHPKYLRAAKSNPEIDFYEVDFAQNKPLCKHMGVESLPTGMIFKDGAKVEHTSLRPSGFKSFVSLLVQHAAPGALESYQSNMDVARAVTLLSDDPVRTTSGRTALD